MNLDIASGEDLALTLSTKPASGAGLLITMLTLRLGKVSCLATGVRKGTSRLCGSVEPLCLLAARTSGTEPVTLREARVIEDFPEIKENWRSTQTALTLSKAIGSLTADVHPQPGIFALLLQSLSSLARNDPDATSEMLIMRLLRATGLRPSLQLCTSCQGPATDPCYYHYAQGGPVCASCPPPSPTEGHPITNDTLQQLRQLDLGVTPPEANGAATVLQRSIRWQSA